ncbi:MAG: protein-methionine-sulfoxide reductase heme-binding subunit MsrQ [Gammaproteobacteria bacterium]|jgi:sulfoxide reductase heme-binding subunit YedZ|nr:protein-methionine-sulfoxide reductase heme-binding subunit MsrQ [Pseudomonadota bacterium]MCZ6731616.1 protein-methionine-sulfoxide reductase heme-binding subunit MsrQ [Gammaproteobacteria bacterium]
MTQIQWIRWVAKPVLFVLCLVPLAWLVWDGVTNNLGANPVETVRRYTGDWTLRFLFIALTVTPLRRLTGWHVVIRLRRMLGLFAFFYACLHFVSYIWLDQFFMWDAIIEDILDRPYITVGVASFLLLIPLAVTSTNGMVRRLGGRRWQRLHQLVYVIAVLGVIHFLWLVKSDISEPVIYGAILALLLGFRLFWHLRGRSRQPAGASG